MHRLNLDFLKKVVIVNVRKSHALIIFISQLSFENWLGISDNTCFFKKWYFQVKYDVTLRPSSFYFFRPSPDVDLLPRGYNSHHILVSAVMNYVDSADYLISCKAMNCLQVIIQERANRMRPNDRLHRELQMKKYLKNVWHHLNLLDLIFEDWLPRLWQIINWICTWRLFIG